MLIIDRLLYWPEKYVESSSPAGPILQLPGGLVLGHLSVGLQFAVLSY